VSHRYYYLDYNHFTNVVRYRVHLMQKELERLEREANENQSYECPTCGNVLSVLQVQSLRNMRFGFCCPNCCSNDLHATCEGGVNELRPGTLVTGYDEVQELKEKLKRQLFERNDGFAPHDGIYNLLSQLQGQALPSNVPSELIALGMGAAAGGKDGKGKGRKGAKGEGGKEGMSAFEEMATMTRDGAIFQDDGEEGESAKPAFREKKMLPDFLRGSRVIKEVTSTAADPEDIELEAPREVERRPARDEASAPEMSEAERQEAYRKAFMEQLQRELKGEQCPAPMEEAHEAPMGMGHGAPPVKTEDEDIDWEEAED
jgi:hypothetical protein